MKAIQSILYMILGGVLLTGLLIGISYAKPGFSRRIHDSLPTANEETASKPSEPLSATVKVDTTPPATAPTTSTEDRKNSVNGITATLAPYKSEPQATSKTTRQAATWGENSTTSTTTSTSSSSSQDVSQAPAQSSTPQTSSNSSSSTTSTSTTTTSTVSPVLIAYGYDESDVITNRADYYAAAKKHIEAYIGNPVSFTILVKGLPVVRQIETAYDNEAYKEGYANDVVKDLKIKGINIAVSSQYIGDDYYVISHTAVLGEKESSSSSSSSK